MARSTTTSSRPAAPLAGTLTLTLEEPSASSSSHQQQQQQPAPQTLVLRLKRPKKKVTWKEGTVDNELLQRKSSKKCCIFHKQKSFDEDFSDGDEDCPDGGPDGLGHRRDDSGAGSSGCCSHGSGEHRSS